VELICHQRLLDHSKSEVAHLELMDAVDLGELHGVVEQSLGDDVQD